MYKAFDCIIAIIFGMLLTNLTQEHLIHSLDKAQQVLLSESSSMGGIDLDGLTRILKLYPVLFIFFTLAIYLLIRLVSYYKTR